MTDRTFARLAWMAFTVALIAWVIVLVFLSLSEIPWGWADLIALVSFFSFSAVGIIIAARQLRNPIGWILLGIGLVWEITFCFEFYIWYAFVGDPGSLWRPDLVVALTSSMWVPGVGLIGTFLILLFPDGRLPSPRWRLMAWASVVVIVAMFLVTPFIPLSLRDVSSNVDVPPTVANPLGIEALEPIAEAWQAGAVLLPLCILGCVAAMVRRFRRSRGHERLQLKWMTTAAAAVAVVFLASMVSGIVTQGYEHTAPWDPILEAAFPFSFALIPVAVGIAVLRYRLYDIDVIINRALVYALLTSLLALVYVGGVVGVGGAVRVLTGNADNSFIIAATTLVIAALFRPARTRIQMFIDRRFYRHKYDATKTVESFSNRLRNEIDLDDLCADLVETVGYTVQPTQVSIWLRNTVSRGRERLHSSQDGAAARRADV